MEDDLWSDADDEILMSQAVDKVEYHPLVKNENDDLTELGLPHSQVTQVVVTLQNNDILDSNYSPTV